jgi:hypothetical protein
MQGKHVVQVTYVVTMNWRDSEWNGKERHTASSKPQVASASTPPAQFEQPWSVAFAGEFQHPPSVQRRCVWALTPTSKAREASVRVKRIFWEEIMFVSGKFEE